MWIPTFLLAVRGAVNDQKIQTHAIVFRTDPPLICLLHIIAIAPKPAFF